jgi:hypothetical protein
MYLYYPPPVACVHLVIDTAGAFATCVVSLRGEHQMICKPHITIKSLDALHGIPNVEFELLIPNLKLLEFERWSAR